MLLVGTDFINVLFLPLGFKFGSRVMLYAATLSWYDLVGAVALYTFVIGFFGLFFFIATKILLGFRTLEELVLGELYFLLFELRDH